MKGWEEEAPVSVNIDRRDERESVKSKNLDLGEKLVRREIHEKIALSLVVKIEAEFRV